MSRLSVAFIVVVSGIALTQVALAADMPLKAPIAKAPIAAPRYDWSGFYVGGHVGYLWGRTRVEEDGVVTEPGAPTDGVIGGVLDRKSTRLNSSHLGISYAVFCLKKNNSTR